MLRQSASHLQAACKTMCAPRPSSPAQPQLFHECGYQHLHSSAKQCTAQALLGHSFCAHLGERAVPAGDEHWKSPLLEHMLNCWPCSSSMSLGPRLLQVSPISGPPHTAAPAALELKGGPCTFALRTSVPCSPQPTLDAHLLLAGTIGHATRSWC